MEQTAPEHGAHPRWWVQWLSGPTVRGALFHAVFVGSVTATKSATNALFLANQPPQGIALLYMAVAGMVALATGMLAGPLHGYPPRVLLRWGAWLFFTVLSLFTALFMAGVTSVLGPLYVAGELYATCLSILFWSTVSGWFDARGARRAFGLISAGGMAGAVVGGAAMRALVPLVGAQGVTPLMGLVTLLALPLLAGPVDTVQEAPRKDSGDLLAGASYLVEHPYPRAVALLAAFYAALGACVDYVFRLDSATRMDEQGLATLFGDLNAVVGVVAGAYQLLLTSRVLEKVGLFYFLSIIPGLLLVSATAAVLMPRLFAVVVVMKGLEMAGAFSILQSGMQLLYNPVPRHSRAAVRAFVDGLVKKGGVAIAGLGLAILVPLVPHVGSAWSVVALAAGCLAIIRWLRGQYLGALEDKLRGSTLHHRLVLPPVVDVADRVTRSVLIKALDSPEPGEVLAALAILRRDPRFRLEDHLQALLSHPDEAVRMTALEAVPSRPSAEIEFVLASILAMDERRPRAAAARAFARCHPERAGAALRPYLHDPDPGVTCAVIAALHSLPGSRELAEERLRELLGRREVAGPAERREVARLLGEMPTTLAVAELPAFLVDAEASVRALAIMSAGRLCARAVARGKQARVEQVLSLVPALEARLAVRSDRAPARAAIAQLKDHVTPLLKRDLDDRRIPLRERIEIPRLLRAIGTQAAAEALLFSNIQEHPSLRYRIAETLFMLHKEHPHLELDRARTDAACRRRLHGFCHYRPLCHALHAAQATAPRDGQARRAWDVLVHIVTDRLLQNLQMALRLLGLHRGTERMDRVGALLMSAEREALHGAPRERVQSLRADALEILDVALTKDPVRAEVMRCVEPLPPAWNAVELPWKNALETARALSVSADPLVAALAGLVLRNAGWMLHDGGAPLEPRAPEALALVNDPTDLEEVPNMDEMFLSRLLALERVDLFVGLPVDDVAAIAGIAQERHAEPNEYLYREGEPGDCMYVLLSGKVQLMRSGRVFMELGPGESIGQVSLLDRGPRPTTALVGPEPDGAEMLCIHYDAFLDLVTDRPELARALFSVLGKRLRALIDMQVPRAEGPVKS